jgi:hypothetical protein
MNDDALDLSELDGTGIRLCYGLTASLAKDRANKLMIVLADVFKKEYEARTGKIPSDTQIDVRIDFEEFNPEELRQAFAHFASLSAAFQSEGRRSSADFCLTILNSISSALDTHCGVGHA